MNCISDCVYLSNNAFPQIFVSSLYFDLGLRLQSLFSAVDRTNPNFTVGNWKREPNARLCELVSLRLVFVN